jgi:hypothetical protein
MNLINPLGDIPSIPEVRLGRIGGGGTSGGMTWLASENRGAMGSGTNLAVPMTAVPNLAVPTAGGGGGGGGGGSRVSGAPSGLSAAPNAAGLAAADFFSQGLDNPRVRQDITVNVNGGLGTSAEIGAAVVDAIRQYNNVNGPAPIAVA